jgi:acetyltransferase
MKTKQAIAPNFHTPPMHFDPEETVFLREYDRVKLRFIRRKDEGLMVDFHGSLSEESVFLRYFEHISLDTRTLHERLARVCHNTDDSLGIVAELPMAKGPSRILGVGRLTTTAMPGVASFAILISDEAQDTNLPRQMLHRLIEIARAYRFDRLTSELLVADHDMQKLCRRANFELHTRPEEGIVEAVLPL